MPHCLNWVFRLAAGTVVVVLLAFGSSNQSGTWAVGKGRNLSLRAANDLPVASVVLRHGSAGHHGAVSTANSTLAVCDKDMEPAGSIAGVAFVAAQDNGICTTGEAVTYENGGTLYVAQAGGEEAAFTIPPRHG